MDTTFVFPRPSPATPRPPTVNSRSNSTNAGSDSANRESDALRASVLDAALLLGIGSNNTVANWMFNNSLEEAEEPQPSPRSPDMSSAASSESSSVQSPLTPPSSFASPSMSNSHRQFSDGTDSLQHDFRPSVAKDEPQPYPTQPYGVGPYIAAVRPKNKNPGLTVAITEPIKPSSTPLKQAENNDGIRAGNSDGGAKTSKLEGNASKEAKKEASKGAKLRQKEEKLSQQRETAEERKRKKSFVSLSKPKKNITPGSAAQSTGYETHAPPSSKGDKKSKKSNSASGDGGYDTDGGYLSSTPNGPKSKSKSRFFKRGGKASKPDLAQEAKLAAEKEKEKEKSSMPLPIASRFATTLGPTLSNVPSGMESSTNASTTTVQTTALVSTASTKTPVVPSAKASSPSTESPRAPQAIASPPLPDTGRQKVNFVENAVGSVVKFAQLANSPKKSTASPSKFPVISYPLSRGESSVLQTAVTPASPRATPSSPSGTQSQPPWGPRSNSPAGLRPESPYVLVTPVNPDSTFASRATTPLREIVTPSPRETSLTRPHTPQGRRNLNADIGRETAPYSASLAPSPSFPRSNSPMYSPSVLAYYDVAPRSPPPMGPLPRTPKGPPAATPASTRPRMEARSFSPMPSSRPTQTTQEQGLPVPSNIQRGRQSPFPSRPVQQTAHPAGIGANTMSNTVGVGPRRRPAQDYTAYPVHTGVAYHNVPYSGNDRGYSPRDQEQSTYGIDVVEPTEDGWEQEDGEYGNQEAYYFQQEQEEAEVENMHDVLNRFTEARLGGRSPLAFREQEGALGRKRSFEELNNRRGRVPQTSEERLEPMKKSLDSSYSSPESGEDARTNRWSGSIYSRASFLDPDKSEETRERFLQRVGQMYDESGRERDRVPPVPKIPQEYTMAGLANRPGGTGGWNRF